MISKNTISQIRLLHHKKHRDEQGLFIVEGVKSCREALQSDFEIVQCYATKHYTQTWYAANAETWSAASLQTISEKEMERISFFNTSSEMLCILKKRQFNIEELTDEKPLLVLDSLRDPGNLGTIIRTADWFGFDQILCSEDCVEFTNPKVIQATMGSFTRVKIVYFNILQYILIQKERKVYGLFMSGESIHSQSFNNNDIVIIGSESHGISPTLLPYIDNKIMIPIYSNNKSAPESLNAAMAASIFMYEYRK
jgi:TrmH family RNA methyltransferase